MSQQQSISDVLRRIASEFSAVRAEMFNGSSPATNNQKMMKVTMSQYKAIPVKDPYTIYLLVGEE